jgi:ankyrin repeat protein
MRRASHLFAVVRIVFPVVVACGLTSGGCIHWAARDGNVGAAKLWLDLGANIDGHEQLGMANFPFGTIDTPLIIATRHRHPEMVRYLIERGADVNEKGEAWYTPLFVAAHIGDEEIARILLENGARVEPFGGHGSALNHAAMSGHIGIARSFLEHGADINRKGIDGATPLHDAVSSGNVDMVRFLLANGADVNSRAIYGRTPLHNAAEKDDVEIGRILLEHEADTELECNGRTVSQEFLRKLRDN